MKSLRNTVLGLTLSVTGASFAMADDLTIAIVNNALVTLSVKPSTVLRKDFIFSSQGILHQKNQFREN